MYETPPNRTASPQIFGDQPTILRELAQFSSNRSNFLEIGSWLGDSTLIIGEVARKKGGRLFCIDWWKGNPGTELGVLAQREDIFAQFWQRIQAAGLEDVVVPIRSHSDFVFDIFAKETFSFVFIDADHRYQSVLDDIRNYLPLVKKGGILSGHDCEGYISDFDQSFLQRGRDQDYYETVHCGVVLGVGKSFAEYSIDNSIWSVVCEEGGRFKPTSIKSPGLERKRQEPPPPITSLNHYHILRYRQKVYAVPFRLGLTDITAPSLREHPEVLKADSLADAEFMILELTGGVAIPPQAGSASDKQFIQASADLDAARASGNVSDLRAEAGKAVALAILRIPPLLGFTREYSAWRLGDTFVALPHSFGLPDLSDLRIPEGTGVIRADPFQALEIALGESLSESPLLLGSHRGFNLVAFKRKIYGLAQSLGPVDLNLIDDKDLGWLAKTGKCVITQAVKDAKVRIDRLFLIARRRIKSSQTRRELSALRQTVTERDSSLFQKNVTIAELERRILQQEADIASLKSEFERTAITLELHRL